jgi:hypothetical protein
MAVGGLGWALWQTLEDPGFEAVEFTQADGARAQQKLFDIVRRPASPSTAGSRVSLTEREVDALVSPRIGDAVGLPVRDVQAVLVADTLAVRCRMPLGALLGEPPFSRLAAALPAAALTRPVWIEVRGRVRVERPLEAHGRKFLRFDPTYLAVGRQRLPALFYRVLLPPSAMQPLRWPVPSTVEAVTVEPGRIVIRTTS